MNITNISITERKDLNRIQMQLMMEPNNNVLSTYMSIKCAERLINSLSCVIQKIKDKESFKELLPELEFSKSATFYKRDTLDFDEVEIAKTNYYNKLLMRGVKK